MKAFFKTKKGKRLLILTAIALVAAFLGIFKVWADHQNYELMQTKIDNPITQKVSKDSMRKDKIHMFTDNDLLKYRKEALRKGVDKYPNGYLEIPSISIKLPIYNRANNLTLSLGVGKDYYLDSQFGQGNVVLAGHNMERHGILLSDLYKVKNGQEIILHGANDTVYRYKIFSKKVQSPYVKLLGGKAQKGSAYYLPEENEKPIVTVYDCANHGKTRLVVQAELEQ